MTLQKISFEYDIPDGYRFVGVRPPIKGEEIIMRKGGNVQTATFNHFYDSVIVEKIPEQEHVTDAMSYHHPANPNRRKHADLIHAWAEGAEIQFQRVDGTWEDVQSNNPVWHERDTYRIKPKTKTVRFRNWLSTNGCVCLNTENTELHSMFKKWLGDWQEVEIEG